MPKSKSKKKSKKVQESDASDDDGNIHDERFQMAQTRPQFQKLHTRKNKNDDSGSLIITDGKGKVDDRFSAMLTDSRFALGGEIGVSEGGVDKYGRKQKKKKKDKSKEEKDDDDDDDDDDASDKKVESEDEETSDTGESDSDKNESDDDEAPEDPESRIAFLTALSRGEVDVSSSSDDESSSDEEDGGHSSDDDSTGSEDSLYGKAGVLDPSTKDDTLGPSLDDAEITYDDSRFLAVCNMDWSSVRAVDLLAIVSSFSPPGSVKDVTVYPSDFGIERMEKDLTLGPQGIWKKQKNKNKNIEEENETGKRNSDGTDEESDDNDAFNEYENFGTDANEDLMDNDFDAEKLRAYEVSKMKYYFAVVEFTISEAADAAYKELDGMEVGHSSANMDLRAIPEADVEGVVEGRKFRDQATSIPSNYTPPDFVVAALQNTAVKCTWEEGDKERERLLTQYGVGNDAWAAMTEGDDLRAYLASDASSDEESADGSSSKNKKNKAKNMRALLGLGGSEDEDESHGRTSGNEDDDDSFFGSGNLDSDSDDGEEEGKQVTIIPGKSSLEEKIRSRLKEKSDGVQELTPWEKYKEKRKEKRKEKKRLKKEEKASFRGEGDMDDPFAASKKKSKGKSRQTTAKPSSKEELDLLLAGDNDEETAKDFHMRDLVRIEKNKSKKLRGSRKRKEDEIRNNASGLDFKLDTKDDRFAAVLDGADDRFGIDRTDPQYKETPAMRDLLSEQTKRRKSKKRAKKTASADVNADAIAEGGNIESSGALALSSLVKNLKKKVAKN